ncbi:hypothetical protein NWFMUON74_09720 [Nocardia wallacei]|uniref:Uncharacterized protein n=1 Tax=Nocardia wallacei TaxID=480035 RepID=A0A7G1KDY0_9NOCA|nr:hypothetical protein NWFMUON74_09720 [Nocardia wallacei]
MDLESAESQSVRAAIESNTIAEFLSIDYTYPGWRERSEENNNYDADRPHPMYEGVGTAYLHIVPLVRPNGIATTVVCKDMTSTAKKIDGKYPLPEPGNRKQTLEAIAVDVGGPVRIEPKSDNPVKVPPGPQIPGPAGRDARPSRDVFTRFPFVNYQYNLDNYRDLCLPWATSRWGGNEPPKPERTPDDPPKIESFSPGWPK